VDLPKIRFVDSNHIEQFNRLQHMYVMNTLSFLLRRRAHDTLAIDDVQCRSKPTRHPPATQVVEFFVVLADAVSGDLEQLTYLGEAPFEDLLRFG
jgi:hypothetical protein